MARRGVWLRVREERIGGSRGMRRKKGWRQEKKVEEEWGKEAGDEGEDGTGELWTGRVSEVEVEIGGLVEESKEGIGGRSKKTSIREEEETKREEGIRRIDVSAWACKAESGITSSARV